MSYDATQDLLKRGMELWFRPAFFVCPVLVEKSVLVEQDVPDVSIGACHKRTHRIAG